MFFFLPVVFIWLIHTTLSLIHLHTSHGRFPIKISFFFFHFSLESDIPEGFLCFPISSVSLSNLLFSHLSQKSFSLLLCSTFEHSVYIPPDPYWLILDLSEHLRKEWNHLYLQLPGNVRYGQTPVAIFFLFFEQLYFSHVIKPQLRQQ